jgi:hypothetical protein
MGVIRSRTLSKNNSRRNSSTSRQQHKAKIQQHGLLEETKACTRLLWSLVC